MSNTNVRAKFKYSDSLRSQGIRLLNLKYGRQEEMIHFNLHTHTLQSTPDYIALSYTWGNPKDTIPVLCDGKIIDITRSLEGALRQLRKSQRALLRETFPERNLTQPLYFWIDAVCINQSDIEEKNCQVGLMADIYREACKVIIWLGPADDSSDSVMDYLNMLGAKAEDCGMDIGPDPYREIWQEMVSISGVIRDVHQPRFYFIEAPDGGTIRVTRKALQDLFYSISGWNDDRNVLPIANIKRLFTRPWWGRIWVLQEVAIPEKVEFTCGTKRITRRRCSAALNAYCALWSTIASRYIDIPRLRPYHLEIFLACFQHKPLIMLSSWQVYRFWRFPLAALLRLTCVGSHNIQRHGPHHLDSTDARDKIYALLSIAADREELKLKGVLPDYGKSKEETFTTAMAALLEQGHISLLSFCQISEPPSDLPSWVPDWSRSMIHKLQDVENDHITIYPRFSASGPEPQHPSVTIVRKDGGIEGISVICQIYDKIYAVGSFPGRSSSHEVPILETFSWPTEWLVEIIRLTYLRERDYQNFGDRLRASARTSIGEVGFDRGRRLTRVGESRFHDAVCLLQSGARHVKQSYIKSEIEKYLDDNGIRDMSMDSIGANQRLGSEIMGRSLRRLPCVTNKGHLVLSSEHVNQGDVIALIRGAQIPFILRHQSSGKYQIISEAYVDGIMDGEAMKLSKCQAVELV